MAVSVTILDSPSSVGEEKFNLTVKIAGASAGTNFLRADLYKEGSKNYFGETDNGQAWYFGSDGKQYLPVTILSGVDTIATMSARLGDPSTTDYPGPGQYFLRIRRYTSSGNQGSEDSSPVSLILTKVWPTPPPSPSPSPTPTATPTPTPTLIPSPSAQIPTPTPKPSIKPSLKPSIIPSPALSSGGVGTVAGETTAIDLSSFVESSPSPLPSPTHSPAPKLNYQRVKIVLLIGGSLLILSLALFLLYQRIHKSKDDSLL